MNLKNLFLEDYSSNKISNNAFNHLLGKKDKIEIVHNDMSNSSSFQLNEDANLDINTNNLIIVEVENKESYELKTTNEDINIDFEFEQAKQVEPIEIDFKFKEVPIEKDKTSEIDSTLKQNIQDEIIDFGFSEPIITEFENITDTVSKENNELNIEVQNHFQQFENEKYVEKILAAKKMLELNFEVSKIEDITGIRISEIENYSYFLNSKNQMLESESEIEQIKNDDSILIENKISETQNIENEEVLIQDIFEKKQNVLEVLKIDDLNREASNSFFDWLNELNHKESDKIKTNNQEVLIEKKIEKSLVETIHNVENSLEIEQQIQLNEIEYQGFDDKVNEFIISQIETKKKDTKANPKKNTLNEIPETSEFLSETLADLYLKQGFKDKAKSLYEKLIQRFPEKSTYFADKIKNCN
jgi:hypothetical protein